MHKPEIRIKRRGQMLYGDMLHVDARPHNVVHTVEAHQQLRFEI
jgi:hypothetical protein